MIKSLRASILLPKRRTCGCTLERLLAERWLRPAPLTLTRKFQGVVDVVLIAGA
jgi:hypothetical protein